MRRAVAASLNARSASITSRIESLKEQLEQLRLQLDAAVRAGEYAKASELQYGRIPQLERRLADCATAA